MHKAPQCSSQAPGYGGFCWLYSRLITYITSELLNQATPSTYLTLWFLSESRHFLLTVLTFNEFNAGIILSCWIKPHRAHLTLDWLELSALLCRYQATTRLRNSWQTYDWYLSATTKCRQPGTKVLFLGIHRSLACYHSNTSAHSDTSVKCTNTSHLNSK